MHHAHSTSYRIAGAEEGYSENVLRHAKADVARGYKRVAEKYGWNRPGAEWGFGKKRGRPTKAQAEARRLAP